MPSSSPKAETAPTASASGLLRQVGLFDATMIVMGGIVGSGIFINPYVVAQQVHTPLLILGVWARRRGGAGRAHSSTPNWRRAGPLSAGNTLTCARPFIRVAGFLYGWVLLLVIQTGGMAAVTVTFARYFLELTGWHISERLLVVVTLAVLTVINCLGVKLGSRMQSVLMVLKIAAIAGLVAAGLFAVRSPHPLLHPLLDRLPSFDLLTAIGAAMVPVLFAFGGWQTTNFIAGEIKDPRAICRARWCWACRRDRAVRWRELRVRARARAAGSGGNACAGDGGHAGGDGRTGARLIALGITISTLGFLSQSVLTAPRVYFAMARDGLFFHSVAKVTRRTHVPRWRSSCKARGPWWSRSPAATSRS